MKIDLFKNINVYKMYADNSKVFAEAVDLDQVSTLQEDIGKI